MQNISVINNVVVKVMQDLLQKELFSETLNYGISHIFQTSRVSDKLSNELVTVNSFIVLTVDICKSQDEHCHKV